MATVWTRSLTNAVMEVFLAVWNAFLELCGVSLDRPVKTNSACVERRELNSDSVTATGTLDEAGSRCHPPVGDSIVSAVQGLPQGVEAVVASFMSMKDVAALGRTDRNGAESIWNNGTVWTTMAAERKMNLGNLKGSKARDAFRRKNFRLDGAQLRVLCTADHREIFQEAAYMTRGLVVDDCNGVASLILSVVEPALHRRDPTCALTACAAEHFLAAARAAVSILGKAEVARLERAYESVSAEALFAQRDLLIQDMQRALWVEDFGSLFSSEEDDMEDDWPEYDYDAEATLDAKKGIPSGDVPGAFSEQTEPEFF